MVAPADRDYSKLPKWAQSELTKLKADVRYWKGKATVGPEDSDTFAGSNYSDEQDAKPLGKSERIYFKLKDGEVEVYTDPSGEFVHVRSAGGFHDALIIQPMSANAAKVKNGEWI
jgi:hypothetical protein